MNRIFQCIIILSIMANAAAKEIHVDQRHTNGGDGSAKNPFTTIAQAAILVEPGDVCFIHQGIYREVLCPQKSGTASKPIIFKAFGNDVVIISATDEVKGWEPYKDHIFVKKGVEMTMNEGNNLFCNGTKMQIARWPNDTDNDEYTLDAKYIDKAEGTYSMSFISNSEIPDFDWTGGIIHYLGAHSGCSWERTITGFDAPRHRILFDTLPNYWPFGTTHSPYRFENGHRGIFYLMNKFEALDVPKEWYYDLKNKALYFYAPNGADPNTALTEYAARKNTAMINSNYVQLCNLNFFGGMITIKGSNNIVSHCMIKHGIERLNTNADEASTEDAAIVIADGAGNVIEKCVLEHGTMHGILLNNDASDNRVENCIVQYFNTMGNHTGLIFSLGKGNKILRNSLLGSARDGVKVTGDNSEMGYNHVQNCLISGADGGLFYVTGSSKPRNIEIHHNWFNYAYAAEHAGNKAAGIYLDNNSAGYIVHHNVVWDVEWGGLHFNWNAVKNEIYNNTFWNVGPSTQSVIDSWVPIKNNARTNVKDNKLYNNISDIRPWWESGDGPKYLVNEKEYLGEEADNDFKNNEQYATPPFISFDQQNFAPAKGSAIIDKGITIRGITDHYKGKAPDLGAYEQGGENWKPGVDWTPTGFAWTPGDDYAKIKTTKLQNEQNTPLNLNKKMK